MEKINLRFQQLIPAHEQCFQELPTLSNYRVGNLINVPFCRLSQVVETLVSARPEIVNFELFDNENTSSPYLFPIAVMYCPQDWTNWGADHEYDEKKKSIFEYLPDKLIRDMQMKRALLLIDQSVEGYSAEWLWDWFHVKCKQYSIDPSCIMYTTGDQLCTDTYERWCNDTSYAGNKLVVFPATSLFFYIKRHVDKFGVEITSNEMLTQKKHNTPEYLYDCFMLRPRAHRILNYLHLYNEGLLEYGNIGMADISKWSEFFDITNKGFLEKFGLQHDVVSNMPESVGRARKIVHTNNDATAYSDYAERILTTMYENSWITLVVESTYFENEPVFVSEKSIKPIAYMQPFITVGSKGTLKCLRSMGYKTFHPIIDESYDEETNDGERFKKIMKELKRIHAVEDKVAWLAKLMPMIEHNYNLFREYGKKTSPEHLIINNYYNNFFKDLNVPINTLRPH